MPSSTSSDDGQPTNMSFEFDENSFGHDDGIEAGIVMMQDDDSWGIGSYDDNPDQSVLGYKMEALQQARQYVASVRDHMLPFTKDEITAIKLMSILKKKKASLDTYDDLMKWHIDSMPAGARKPTHISRQKMIHNLAMRHNQPTKTVKMAKREKQLPELVKKKPILPPKHGKMEVVKDNLPLMTYKMHAIIPPLSIVEHPATQ